MTLRADENAVGGPALSLLDEQAFGIRLLDDPGGGQARGAEFGGHFVERIARPVAGVVHAVTLLVITLFAGPLAARIPLAALAAILVVVAYNMSEWRTFRAEIQMAPRSDTARA